ncbi:ABC transporter ATP-binding protein [Enterococcus casseliflavus]|uniref:Multidrug resistance ABC transporter ATP-binding and permease protein n=1 Tax=Enterococcus casseliflavus TaxID=37734 RepID=A0ABD6Z139_ENTCA|nr:ABC transporter ATP-binding protein [Enterococcus casseliflavus]EOH79178.1 ABC transporter ATP-binding/permease [Enterococcus casseliflavus ATCC 49996]EOU09016.1 ABC transporter ATP-binding/permease [Enterococcus casseliflavus ATCC 49996]MBE9879207.1 ABC transporter ATP-binding protein [Enterococcus casseliflavus]MDT2972793.1 ABC transporter ATP-binding protein [Enterococcus casseliflavus]QGN30039.1 ATP-binding cassette domain-containing protein [Enterococcus casseliflavus]
MLKRFFRYYRPYRSLFILDFTCAVFAGLLELAFPVAVNQVIDKIMPQNNFRLILLACLGLFLFYVINTVLQYIVVFYGHKLGVNIETDMRQELFRHLQTQSFEYYDNQKTGKLISRLTTDLFEISEVAHHGPEDVFITIMTLVGSFLLMLNMHVQLAVATFALIPLITIALVFFNKKMTKVNTQIYDNIGEFNAGVEASVSGIRVTQSFANETFEHKRFDGLSEIYRQSKILFYKVMAISSAYNYFLIRLINLFALIFGAYYVIRGELTNGQFVGFILLSNVFVRPIEKVNTMIESYPKGIAGFKRLTEELDKEPTIKDKPGARAVTSLKGDIVYHDVSFSYADATKVLNHIDLSIKAGETIAFVGQSGSGKTTLCNLLPRFYEVTEGAITIDGINIQEMTLASLRQQIGTVQQDVFLFPGTIRENIAYGKLDATEEEILKAVKLAHLEKVIDQMTDGLDTVIGERGVKLSGGQKQRVAIARMFLKNPPILILDEATSALDTETEQVIQESLNSLADGRTTLIIAHRLATIKHATRIIVVSEKGILEEGTHEELMARKGHYRALHDAQFARDRDPALA